MYRFSAQMNDLKVFGGQGSSGVTVEEALASGFTVVQEMKKNAKFTDTDNFTLRCMVCFQGLKGAAECAAHAQQTGHQNYSEYK